MIAIIITALLALTLVIGFVALVVSIHRADRRMSASVRARMATRGVQWT
ncbi:hypothetical protein [Nonomuraea endophytica]|uniref:Uncharacterized protein n=1 Tax=Nonomuraea endophytica TaxID=714136 RepID=A0A7W8EJH2_9ACTN|nr:hypothetical protein [Nonomuraea endophytica]MBB5080682.1 hypothetical protein [Nonomuraea endophytica]